MRKVLSVLVLLLGATCSPPGEPAARKLEALTIFDQFQSQLLRTLTTTIQEKGIAPAIVECRTASPEMERMMSGRGWTVRRVSDRPRNPGHKPDEFESRVLAQWQRERQAGKPLQPVVAMEAGELRVMRPIVIQADLCLRCHGTPDRIDPAVRAELARLYPADQATGYGSGELRGAFSAVRPAD